MNAYMFSLSNLTCLALPSGALFVPDTQMLCVSDMHLGKSDRIARRSGALVPPYETRETLHKLAQDIAQTDPQTVICLGDSFDDLQAAQALAPADLQSLAQLQAGRNWIWIEGNHDPGPIALGGTHLAQFAVRDVVFRHIATAAAPEVSGHYHPKHRVQGAGAGRACFVYDANRLIMPAYGAYTGGLWATTPVIRNLFSATAVAILTGRKAIAMPLP